MNMKKQQVFVNVVFLTLLVALFFVIAPNTSSYQAVTSSISCHFKEENVEDQINKPDGWRYQPLENWTVHQIIDYSLWTNSSSCLLSHGFGGVISGGEKYIDGQKFVCLDKAVAPIRTFGYWPMITKNRSSECLVYSFGINNEWSFDEDMQKFGCRVYAFDPSMNVTNHNHSSKIHFYNLGLGDRDEILPRKKWKMMSLDSIYYKMLDHGSRIIDYLKIDIEGGEWTALPQIMSSGMLNRVRQLGIEFHLVPEGETTLEIVRQRVKIIKTLEDEYGFFRFDSKYAPFGWMWKAIGDYEVKESFAYEMAFYNSKLRRRSPDY